MRSRRSDRKRRMPKWQSAKSACRVTAQEMAWVHCCGRRRPRQTLTSMSRRFPTTRSLCSRVSRAVKLYCSLGRIGVGVCNRTTSEHAQVCVLTRCFRSEPANQDSLCLQFIQRSVRHQAVIARVSPASTAVTSCSMSGVRSLLRSASTSLSATAEFVNDIGEATEDWERRLSSRESQTLNGEHASGSARV